MEAGPRRPALTRVRLLRFTAGAWLSRLAPAAVEPATMALFDRQAPFRPPADRAAGHPHRRSDRRRAHLRRAFLAGRQGGEHAWLFAFRRSRAVGGWSEEVHGFGWLRHLRAAGTALSRANAHALVEDWLNLDARGSPDRRSGMAATRVAARRLISWLSQSPIILENADHAFYRRFLRAVETHVADAGAGARRRPRRRRAADRDHRADACRPLS